MIFSLQCGGIGYETYLVDESVLAGDEATVTMTRPCGHGMYGQMM